MNLPLLAFIASVQAALWAGWNYFIKEETEQQFKLLGNAASIESLELLDSYLDGSPNATLALIDDHIYAKSDGTIFLATFRVQPCKADGFFDILAACQEKENLPSLIGFTEQILDHEGIITVLLQTDAFVGFFESWLGTKSFQITEQSIDVVFGTQYRSHKSTPMWKVALEDPSVGLKIIAEVPHVGQLHTPIKFGSLGVEKSRLIVERTDFALTQSHDRFELNIDRAYGMRSVWFVLEALQDDGEIFGVSPWLGLETALRFELSTASPDLFKICVYFSENAVNKTDIQRILSGFPYYSLMEDMYFEPQLRKIPTYLIDSFFGLVKDLQCSVLAGGENKSVRKFAFPGITAKKLKDPNRTLEIHRANALCLIDIFGLSYSFTCSNIPTFIARFWMDFINNKRLPEYVSQISHYTFRRSEDSGQSFLLVHLPSVYASQVVVDSLQILVYLFFRYCGIESDQPVCLFNYNSDTDIKASVANIDLGDLAFDMYNFDMKWVAVKYKSLDEWISPAIRKQQKKKGTPKKPAQPAMTETEVKVLVSVPKPLVFPRSKPTATAPPPAAENASSWDHFFAELDD